MRSVQHQFQAFLQGSVSADQSGYLDGLLAMLGCDLLEDGNLVAYQAQVVDGRPARSTHALPSRDNGAGQDDAVIGFGWGHGEPS